MHAEHSSSRSLVKNRADKRKALLRKREIAKWGMIAAMGSLVATGFYRSRTARKAHIVAGVALLGLTYWHQLMYNPNGKQPKT